MVELILINLKYQEDRSIIIPISLFARNENAVKLSSKALDSA
jgi:hypothetical protein